MPQQDHKSVRTAGSASSRPGRELLSRGRIARRVAELGDQIAARYDRGELTVLVVLSGAVIFAADLVRRLTVPVRLEFADLHSYPGCSTRSQGIQAGARLPQSLGGRDVLVVDDILDSGQTLGWLLKQVGRQGPRSLSACVLLRKDRADLRRRVEADWVGFDIEDLFVVGYGLDYDNLYRNLGGVHVLEPGQREGAP
ncbi:MAG TPA: phosphoribosyltransferase family protein [Phycisphaerae bacterium]|nr:phosphoribosyltransferase family protein [Phycisphaerae bacterium]